MTSMQLNFSLGPKKTLILTMADIEQVLQAEMAIAAPLRFSATLLQGVDQIISVSQDCINAVLTARFDHSLNRKKDKRLRQFKHAIADYGQISAVLDAPRLQMIVPEDPESVFFFLNFGSGTFDYWSGFGPKARLKTQDIAGWSVAFKTTFGLKKLVTIPPEIADQVTLLKPGSYSASQLILGFSAAAAAEIVWDKSICPGLVENQDLKFASQNMFTTYMNVYMQWLATGPYSVLGYTIKVEDPAANANLRAPSFPPTAVTCRTQAYLPQTDALKGTVTPIAGLDSFIFEEMTETRPFPDVPYEPSKAGNWIVGGVAVNLTMSKRIFFERFICLKFETLNMQCIAIANDAYWWVYKKGWKGYKIRDNDWKLDKDSKPGSASWSITSVGASYYRKFENLTSNNTFFGGQWRDNLTTEVDNKLTYTAGSDTVNLTVKITMVRDKSSGGHGEGFDSLEGGNTTISWSGSINLGNIKDGELAVDVQFSNPDLKHKYDATSLAWDWGGDEKRRYETEAQNALSSGINGLADLRSDISKAVNQQSSFVFPGAGDYYMKNARFNGSGDLLLEMSFIQKAIAIDEDFYLQVSAPVISDLNKKWLKVENNADNSTVILVSDKNNATLFQLDDGNLVVDQQGLATGSRSITRPAPDEDLAEIFFVTSETFEKGIKESEKLEFSTTGSKFDYSFGEKVWWATFTLDNESSTRVQFFKGDPDYPGSKKVFVVNAVY